MLGNTTEKNMNFWHTANLAFSDEEREAFNNWKLALFLASAKVNDDAHALPDEEKFSYVAHSSRKSHAMVCAIPSMFGRVPNA
jgi:hypothetical protein